MHGARASLRKALYTPIMPGWPQCHVGSPGRLALWTCANVLLEKEKGRSPCKGSVLLPHFNQGAVWRNARAGGAARVRAGDAAVLQLQQAAERSARVPPLDGPLQRHQRGGQRAIAAGASVCVCVCLEGAHSDP
eukprot:1133400-Pelagomonas_calceolata.AAC.4